MNAARWRGIGIVIVLHAGLYLGFACQVGVREIAASLVSAGLGTIAMLVFMRAGHVNIRARGRDLVQAWRIPLTALTGVVTVMGVLLRQIFLRRRMPSSIRAVPFEIGSRRSMYDAGRRALAATYPTATPNFIVLGFIDQDSLMVYHSVAPGPLPVMVRKLGGGQ